MGIQFDILDTEGLARRGLLKTSRGVIHTPAFMPVGTAATVKGLLPSQVENIGTDIILGNTYHLMLRPGVEIIDQFGGLNNFMNWEGPILTDSGGFQIMSLAGLRQIDNDGVTFKSHIDGSLHRLTPEKAIEIQTILGSDISMVLDECVSFPADYKTAADAVKRSTIWAKRCKTAYYESPGRGLFGIIQGSIYKDLRMESLEMLNQFNFDGIAIGGLAVGEGQENMLDILKGISCSLPDLKPHYLMGVGTPDDIVNAVSLGVDMFDCVLPTRSGRTGRLYTLHGHINIKNSIHSKSEMPIDLDCDCKICNSFSRSYIHHLFRCKEMLGPIVCSIHNLYFYQNLMKKIRISLEKNNFKEFHQIWKKTYKK
ncbi:MAG: tRNA guanosine(34) transglycosylase Tgt [Rhodospirillaceae bacterium]|nr:tRNA guanosine(34) transglycosylase Tgt [Rhodospirillaceae bacterium]|tara:strand:- start:447 stop:1553 length:1107 start_codon:yes stop_codon:yes gene_type:complete